jgi:hypothetical protein
MYGKSPEAVDKQAVGNDTVVYSFQDKRFPPYTRSVVQTGLAQLHVFNVMSASIRHRHNLTSRPIVLCGSTAGFCTT